MLSTRVLFVTCFGIAVGACSSAKIRFQTNPPEAEIFVKPVGSGAEQSLGKTPKQVESGEIEKQHGGSGPLSVVLRKPGYAPYEILVTEMLAGDTEINVELKPSIGIDDPLFLNTQIDRVFQAQNLVRLKKYDEALALLAKTQEELPQLAVTYELIGGIRFFRGNKVEALDAFQKALALYPKSLSALNMKTIIQGGNPLAIQAAPAGTPSPAPSAAAKPEGN